VKGAGHQIEKYSWMENLEKVTVRLSEWIPKRKVESNATKWRKTN
jgi:hypothetical protein